VVGATQFALNLLLKISLVGAKCQKYIVQGGSGTQIMGSPKNYHLEPRYIVLFVDVWLHLTRNAPLFCCPGNARLMQTVDSCQWVFRHLLVAIAARLTRFVLLFYSYILVWHSFATWLLSVKLPCVVVVDVNARL